MKRTKLNQPKQISNRAASAGRPIGVAFLIYLSLLFTAVLNQCYDASPAYAQPALIDIEKTSATGSQNYFRFTDVTEMIRGWKPNQHLYVKGNLRLSTAELVELETWLHKSGHWTVILMEHAQDQRYVNADGRVEVGMDAVELSVSDLMEVGSFRGQTNAITGEQDAAVFVLFLRERKFSYRASEAFNRRGLGQNRWIGKLDRPAYRAMRGGGRIIDAVKDTVKSINAPLRNAIKQEQKIAKERALQRKRALDDLSAQLNQVQQKLKRIKGYAKEVSAAKPDAKADLTNPDIAEVESELATLKTALATSDAEVGSLRKDVDRVGDVSDDWVNLYNEYARFESSETQLQQRRDQLKTNAGELQPAISDELSKVNQRLTSARTSWDAADSQFLKDLNAANHALENATEKLADERTNRAQAQARQSLIRRFALAVTGFLSTLLAGLMFWLNRRRLPAKTRAMERLEQRTTEVKKEMVGMSDLLDRADMVVGDRKAIERKGYQGKTKELSGKALDDIGDMLVMSNSVEKVMDKARDKIAPDSWWQRFKNRWSARGYNDGYEILESKPIEFDESDGISIVRDEEDGPIKSIVETTSDGEQKKTIQLSFAELFQIFRKRSERVQNTITEVETGWTNIVATNNALQRAIDTASQHEQEARELTEQDSLLDVPQLFDELLKSAQADQDASEELGKHDPISAIEGPAMQGLRKAANADELSRQLIAVREKLLPSIRANAQELNLRKREVEWIDVALDDFTQRAQALATDALSQDVAVDIALWRESFEKFTAAVARAVELHDQSTGDVAQSIQSALVEVADAREKIAAQLQLEPARVLNERNRAADDELDRATNHNNAAQASLDRGDTPAAALSIAESQQWIQSALETANESLRVLDELPQQTLQLNGQLDNAIGEIPAKEALLKQLESRFSDSALMVETMVEAIDTTHETGEDSANEKTSDVTIYETVDVSTHHLLSTARRQLESAAAQNESAKAFYAQGRLLEADENYHRADALLESAEANVKLLSDHAKALDQQVADNLSALEQLRGRFNDLEKTLHQHHVTRATQATARRLYDDFETAERSIKTSSSRRSPAAEADTISDVDGQFDQFALLLKTDQDMYEEAGRSIQSLRNALGRGRRTERQSQTDNIPDSGGVRRALSALDDANRIAESLTVKLKSPHEDWRSIDDEADTALASVTQSLARLQSELDKAQAAATAIARASSEYRSAKNWSGAYGIRANPNMVRHSLDQSREALARGDYNAALSLARQSSSAVANAIALAENEVLRRQAAERRAQELRRRRRNRSIGGGSILIPSGFPDFGSGRSSSRRSSSSRSSSGRGGFSRSGW